MINSPSSQTTSRGISRVSSNDEADYELSCLGLAQAYYYPQDWTLVIWERDVFHLTKHTEENLGEDAFLRYYLTEI